MATRPVLISVAVLAVAILIRYAKDVFCLQSLPGPPAPSLFAGHALDLAKARVGTRFNLWGKVYGHTYKLHGPFTQRWLIMADPKGLSHVLSGRNSNYARVEANRTALELWFGKGLFTAEGEEHRKMRKTMSPAFTFQSIQEVSHIFFQLGERLITQWEAKISDQESAIFDVTPTLHMLSLDAISMTMLMHDLSATEGTIPDLLHDFANAPRADMLSLILAAFVTMFPILHKLPSPMKTWAGRLRTELGAIAEEVWSGSKNDDERGQKGEGGMDAKMLRLMNERGEKMSKEEAVAQIIAVLFAGSESSANVMSELLYELAVQPKVQHRLREELKEFERSSGHAPEYEDLMNPGKLPYLDAVVREAVRCKAVVADVRRVAVADDLIPLHFPVVSTGEKHVRVKAGQIVMIPVRDGVNVDEDIWGAEAGQFIPERWLEDGLPKDVELIRAQGHVLTFGDGPKVCLGRIFALAEIKIVVSTIVRHFALEDVGLTMDFYIMGGSTIKSKVRGREAEGVQLPMRVRRL